MVRLVLLGERSEAVAQAVKLLGPNVIAYHPVEGWITVPRVSADAAVGVLKRHGISAEIREIQPS